MTSCSSLGLAALLGSHVGHLVAIWASIQRGTQITAAILLTNLVASGRYHIYDCMDVWGDDRESLETWKGAMAFDFMTSALAFIAVALSLVTMHDDHVTAIVGFLALTPLAFNDERDTATYITIIVSATVAGTVGWFASGRHRRWVQDQTHSHRVRIWWLVAAAGFLAVAIVCQWVYATRHDYAVFHSLWHTAIGLAAACAVNAYNPRTPKKRIRK